jgi:hypothetical protein
MAPQPAFAQQWLQQWKSAEVALAGVHRDELRNLTDADALSASDALLSLSGEISDDRWASSGLIEQQRLFMRSRR